jgi:hypothetical protein
MVVAIYEWSQASSASAAQLRRENDKDKPRNAASAGGTGNAVGGVPAATDVNRGLSTNPSKY